MRKFTLALAERILLRPVVANAQGNLETMRRAFKVLEAIDFTEEERDLILPQGSRGTQAGIIDLDALPANPKEICLEEAEYEWLVRFIDTYQGWQPRKAVFTMVEAIKGAERVSLSLQDPVPRVPQGSQGRSRGKGKPGEGID